ncbi:hypothetical protein [Nocardia sp. NPDC057353]|uniref:hypothetical protein n=1 Tax=Nocardia sp. NPDC057353 TaxID=3346104 RepID=UPI00363555A0
MFRHVSILDTVLTAIDHHVAAPPPERGGGLLGPLGLPVITAFLPDPDAASGPFRLSAAFQRALTRVETAEPDLELKGIAHSRSGAVGLPSSAAVADSLRLAPWLGRFVDVIVTGGNRRAEEHEVLLPNGLMSVFVAEPTSAGTVDIRPARVHIVPVGRDTARLAAMLGAGVSPPTTLDVEGVGFVRALVNTAEFELQLLLPPLYPVQAPLVLVMRGTMFDSAPPAARAFPLAVHWDLTVPAEVRLEHAVRVAREQFADIGVNSQREDKHER